MASLDLNSLSSSQRLAVEQIDGSQLILAGPGVGKTRVIISKILHLLDRGLAPEKILAVTFSRRATQEMEDRLGRLRPDVLDKLNINTLHGFCADLVFRHGFRLGLGGKPRLMTEAQSHLFFRLVAPRLPLQSLVKSSYIDPMIESLLSFFQDCKDEGLWPEDVLKFAQNLPYEDETKPEWLALGDVYNAYQAFCFEKGYIDFGDAILCALRLLEDYPKVKREVQSDFDAILVDEFQDTNWTQNKLLKNIASPECRVTAVGDDDQSIYRFRGASYSAFHFFKQSFPDASTVELNETYRLPPEIAEAASSLIRANGERRFNPNKSLKSLKDPMTPVTLLKSPSFNDEAVNIMDQIEDLLKKGASPKSIAVLVRAHAHADLLLIEAKRRGISLMALQSESLFEQPIVKDVLAFFRLLIDPKDSVSFLRLLDSPFLRMSAEDIYGFCSWAQNQETYLKALEKIEEATVSPEAQLKLQKFYSSYKESFASRARMAPSEILLRLYEASDLIPHLLERDEPSLKLAARLHSELFEWESIQSAKDLYSIFPVLESLSQKEVNLVSDDLEPDPNSVPVLSIHSSKGLEFEHVFILSLVGRRFPSAFRKSTWMAPNELRKEIAPSKESHLDEERRLLYVAMTRAQKTLTLSTVEKKGIKPSSFVTEDLLKKISDENIIRKREIAESRPPVLKTENRQPFSRTEMSKESAGPNKVALKLSFTQLDKYETCPMAYRFKYDLKIPVAMPPQVLVGSAVHDALEKFYTDIKNDEKPNKDLLIRYFEKAFDSQKEFNPLLTERDRELGRDRLSKYYDFHEGKFFVPHAVEKPFNLKVGPHLIRGKIDRVDRSGSGYTIIDYKTGKSRSNDNASDCKFAKSSLQLSIYALAAKEVFDWSVNELVLYYVYDNKVLSSTRTPDDLEKTKERINSTANAILERKFSPLVGRHCKWCEYKSICPAQEKFTTQAATNQII